MSAGTQDILDYIARYKDVALAAEQEYGIPAAITLAQGIVESGAGKSGLTRRSNNHFGMKCGSSWKGAVVLAWDDEKSPSRFRCYASALDSYRDHARLLSQGKRYAFLFQYSVYDYRAWAHGLKKAGYASAPNYAESLIGMIENYKLYSLNGGVKLRPGAQVTIVKKVDKKEPEIDEEWIAAEDEVSEEEEMIKEAAVNYVSQINDLHCTILQPGEDLYSIARKYDISVEKLLKYNELDDVRKFGTGDIVFLEKKRDKYALSRDFYTASGGESLYEVSQRFGIRLGNLARLNRIDPYCRLKQGARVLLK